jgi:hypothetical protein
MWEFRLARMKGDYRLKLYIPDDHVVEEGFVKYKIRYSLPLSAQELIRVLPVRLRTNSCDYNLYTTL